jgi:starch synthase (maltosyl-transferring)
MKGSRRGSPRPAAVGTERPVGVAGLQRVAIERVSPSFDGGRFPIRRVRGEPIEVEADLFADGTEVVRGEAVLSEPAGVEIERVPLRPAKEDRYRARLEAPPPGRYRISIEAWTDPYLTWRRDLARRVAGGRVELADLEEGRALLARGSPRLAPRGPGATHPAHDLLDVDPGLSPLEVARRALEAGLPEQLPVRPDPARVTVSDSPIALWVEPEDVAASAWYEIFPRSTSPDLERPGTLRDLEAWLPYIAELGFDVVYLPPIHPIGATHRKGANGAERAGPGDPGSPWAIGDASGGHEAIDRGLGSVSDFRRLLGRARDHGLEVAIDLAFQCSPDHPWVREHPNWFRHRPDGSIRSAENPPKRYEDVYPLDFDSEDWAGLWSACRGIVDHWVELGVRRFRVDNPHTKPFAFWEWLIAGVHEARPEVQFLAEAFTRPRVMYRLAKVGFTHSYTYFAWRNTKAELTEYLGEITGEPVREFFRPHLWPNTPDILTDRLQAGGPRAFAVRAVLAATLAPNYGIYGPLFEQAEGEAAEPGTEEYLHSEKYEIRHWRPDPNAPLVPLLKQINAMRRAHPALRRAGRLTFQTIDNPELIAYERAPEDGGDPLLIVVNLDPHRIQSGWTDLTLASFGLGPNAVYDVHDLLSDHTWRWSGPRNYVELRPFEAPAQIFEIRPVSGALASSEAAA